MPKVGVQRKTGRNFEMGKRIANFFQPQIATRRDVNCAAKNIRRVFEDAIHLVVTFDEELRALKLHPVGVLDGLSGLNANHHVLSMSVVFAKIVAVVGSDQRCIQLLAELQQPRLDALFHLQALVLNFEEEILWPEDVAVGTSGLPGRVVLPFREPLCDFAF